MEPGAPLLVLLKARIASNSCIRHPETGKLYVNFDLELFQLIRETKCLVKLDVNIPESGKIVLLQEEKYKAYYNGLWPMLSGAIPLHRRLFP